MRVEVLRLGAGRVLGCLPLYFPGACGPTLAILNQTNQNFKPKSQTVKPKLQKTASFSCFSAIWFTVSGFRVQTVKPNR
jgi:hypothetical protein